MKAYKTLLRIYKDTKRFRKKGRFVWCRYYLDDYDFNKRIKFITSLLQDFTEKRFTIELKFWEETDKIKKFFDEFAKRYIIVKQYGNGRKPGILVYNGNALDMFFFSTLLKNHYNYEHAIEPALSMKLLMFIEDDDRITIFDFYDDRGFIINYYYLNK